MKKLRGLTLTLTLAFLTVASTGSATITVEKSQGSVTVYNNSLNRTTIKASKGGDEGKGFTVEGWKGNPEYNDTTGHGYISVSHSSTGGTTVTEEKDVSSRNDPKKDSSETKTKTYNYSPSSN